LAKKYEKEWESIR